MSAFINCIQNDGSRTVEQSQCINTDFCALDKGKYNSKACKVSNLIWALSRTEKLCTIYTKKRKMVDCQLWLGGGL